MPSRQVLNTLLAIALAGLAVFIYFETRQPAEDASQRLTALAIADISRITITNARKDIIHLEMTDGRWHLTAPVKAIANAERIERLIAIATARSDVHYDVSQVDLAQLHLLMPEITIRLNDTLLEIGTTESLDQRRYIKVGNSIRLIVDSYSYLAQGDAGDFVDSQLLVGRNPIIDLELPGFRLARGEKGWVQQDSIQQPSTDILQQLIDEWQQARALKVTRVPVNGIEAGAVRIRFDNSNDELYLRIYRVGNEVIFSPADTQLYYHFTAEIAQRLLNLPVTSPVSTSSGQ